MPENKGYNSKPTVNAAKAKIRKIDPMTKGKGTEDFGEPESVANPWTWMEKDIKPSKGPGEF